MSLELKEAQASWMSKLEGGVVHQEPTWKENEEHMTGLVFKLEGNIRHALTGKLTTDDLTESDVAPESVLTKDLA